MKIITSRRRKAISPILATVILIAITLIAAIAIAGFVFGLFSGFTSTARVTVVQVNLNHVVYTAGVCTGTPLCTVFFQNTGTTNTNVNSMTLTYGGTTCSPTFGAAVVITAGAASVGVTLTTIGNCVAGVSGEAFTGNAALSNGGQVPFSGTFI